MLRIELDIDYVIVSKLILFLHVTSFVLHERKGRLCYNIFFIVIFEGMEIILLK